MMTLAVFLRQQLIKSTFDGLTNLKNPSGETIHNSFPIENLNFEYYLLGGLVLGCVMTYFMFKGKKSGQNIKRIRGLKIVRLDF